MQESHLDEGVIASGNNDVRAVFGIAYSVHIISMRPHPHGGLQAPQSVCHHLIFIMYLTVWGVEPVVTHQTSWLESTGVCGVRQN